MYLWNRVDIGFLAFFLTNLHIAEFTAVTPILLHFYQNWYIFILSKKIRLKPWRRGALDIASVLETWVRIPPWCKLFRKTYRVFDFMNCLCVKNDK
jgi:hypothetical protein